MESLVSFLHSSNFYYLLTGLILFVTILLRVIPTNSNVDWVSRLINFLHYFLDVLEDLLSYLFPNNIRKRNN